MDVIWAPVLQSFDFGIFRVFGEIFKFIGEFWEVIAVILVILCFKFGFFEVFEKTAVVVIAFLGFVLATIMIYVAYDTFRWIFVNFDSSMVIIGIGLLILYFLFKGTNVGEAICTYTLIKWFFKK